MLNSNFNFKKFSKIYLINIYIKTIKKKYL